MLAKFDLPGLAARTRWRAVRVHRTSRVRKSGRQGAAPVALVYLAGCGRHAAAGQQGPRQEYYAADSWRPAWPHGATGVGVIRGHPSLRASEVAQRLDRQLTRFHVEDSAGRCCTSSPSSRAPCSRARAPRCAAPAGPVRVRRTGSRDRPAAATLLPNPFCRFPTLAPRGSAGEGGGQGRHRDRH